MSSSIPNNKILIVAPTAYPLGGVAVWLSYLIDGLEQRGWDITFGAVDGDYHDADKYLQHYPIRQSLKIRNPSATDLGRAQAIAAVIDKHSFDSVVVVNIPDTYRAIRLLDKTKREKLRVIATVHGLLPQLFSDVREYEDVIDDVIVTNKLTKRMIERHGQFESQKVHYAPYGVQLAEAVDASPSKPLQVVYCGRIENDQKRCEDLTEIARQLKHANVDFRFRIAGDGPYREQLLTDLSAFLSKEQVEYLGFVAAEELQTQVYSQADVLVITSAWETGPIVAWEAMANSIPVVSSRYKGYLAENALKDNVNCLMFDVGDTNTAARHIISLQDKIGWQRLSRAGYKLVLQRYSREGSIEAWASALSKILALPASAQPVKSTLYAKNGLLDKVLGVQLARAVRHGLRWPAFKANAGDEWPHTHSQPDADSIAEFNAILNQID